MRTTAALIFALAVMIVAVNGFIAPAFRDLPINNNLIIAPPDDD